MKDLKDLVGRVDRSRLASTDEEILRTSPPELRDLPADFWEDADQGTLQIREAISFRVEADILAYFRAQGPGYQRRMHAVLRAYVDHVRRRAASAPPRPTKPSKSRKPVARPKRAPRATA